jgi:thioredoxin reductase
MNIQDVIIIGGGPAGLNAAVVLGRCLRKVLIFDTGRQRNRLSNGMHNYLTRDDILPADFLKLAHKEIKKYGVSMTRKEIVSAKKLRTTFFRVTDEKGIDHYAKKLLIATGLKDNIPPLAGIEPLYGKSVFHCPYCDGWEVKDKKIGIYAKNKNGFELALSLKTWSKEIGFYTDGKNYLGSFEKKLLKKKNIPVHTERVQMLEGKNGQLSGIVFQNGKKQSCDALFISNGYEQQSNLARDLGCKMSKQGVVLTNRFGQTTIHGLYVAGDVSKDMQFVVVAASEGAKAGVSINKELQGEDIWKNK